MDVTRVVQIVVSIVGIVAIAGLIATGTNEAVLQFAGNVGGKIPLVGTWLNGISSFTKETLSGSFSGTLTAVLQMTFQCISSNILDSFFWGHSFPWWVMGSRPRPEDGTMFGIWERPSWFQLWVSSCFI